MSDEAPPSTSGRGAPSPGTDPDDDLRRFAGIAAWVFDLDNTLYPQGHALYAQMNARIRDFVVQRLGLTPDAATRLQHALNNKYGATLRGLMIEHGVEPDAFLAYVHDIDHSLIDPNPGLVEAIRRLPGKRYVFTNGARAHAEKVTARLGLAGVFDDVFDIVWAGLVPKPDPRTYARMVTATGVPAARIAMFEDLAKNLDEPQRLGMTSVLVVPPGTRALFRGSWDMERGPEPDADFVTDDLTGFLNAVLRVVLPR